jgi:hypothetical protein
MDWMVRDQYLAGARDFALLHSIPTSFKTLSTQVKEPGCETDHSPPSSAEVKNGTPTPLLPYTWCIVN